MKTTNPVWREICSRFNYSPNRETLHAWVDALLLSREAPDDGLMAALFAPDRLEAALQKVPQAKTSSDAAVLFAFLSELLLSPQHRLATYGSLSPGKSNHHQVAGVSGIWREGTTRGVLHQVGWAAAQGFPVMSFDENGSEVPVHVLESAELPRHFARLDDFEGDEYRRELVPVRVGQRVLGCNAYVLTAGVNR